MRNRLCLQLFVLLSLFSCGQYEPDHATLVESKPCEIRSNSIDVIIDHTEPLESEEIGAISAHLRAKLLNAQSNTTVRLHSIGEQLVHVARPVVSLCLETSPNQINEFTTGKQYAQARWNTQIGKVIAAVEDTSLGSPSDTSPILENLVRIAQSSDSSERSVILYSDALQNTDLFSVYSNTRPNINTILDQISVNNLTNTQLTLVMYVRNPAIAHLQDRAERLFWAPVLKKAGLATRFTRI